jgi:hypothetical protein
VRDNDDSVVDTVLKKAILNKKLFLFLFLVCINQKYLTCRKQKIKWNTGVFKNAFEVSINVWPSSGPVIYSAF